MFLFPPKGPPLGWMRHDRPASSAVTFVPSTSFPTIRHVLEEEKRNKQANLWIGVKWAIILFSLGGAFFATSWFFFFSAPPPPPRPFARRDYVYSGREEGGLFGWDFVAFFGHQVEEIRGGTKEDP